MTILSPANGRTTGGFQEGRHPSHNLQVFWHQQQQQVCKQVQHVHGQQQELDVTGVEVQPASASQQTLPVGLVSQAFQKQSQKAVQVPPWQQQHDPYVLDHRIHHEEEQQEAPATAVVQGACLPSSAAPITVPGMVSITNGHDKESLFLESQPHCQSVPGAASNSPALAGPAPPNTRKGIVLLDTAMHTRTVLEFEAVIVLLNGHWPPRGLLSGRWPPKPDTPDTVLSTSLPDSPLGEFL